jgi:hypothetical protein
VTSTTYANNSWPPIAFVPVVAARSVHEFATLSAVPSTADRPAPAQHCPTPRELDDLELLTTGAAAPITGYNQPGSPITLALPDQLVHDLKSGHTVELVDPEGLPLALLRDGLDRWEVEPLTHAQFGPFRDHYLTPAQVREQHAGRTFVTVTDALTTGAREELRNLGPTVVLALVCAASALVYGALTSRALLALREEGGVREAVLLSTCNRTEVYLFPARDRRGEATVERLLEKKALPLDRALSGYLFHRRGDGVVRHLYEVSAGLDSMVTGEAEIQGQVREAYERATAIPVDPPMAGPVLHRLGDRFVRPLQGEAIGHHRLHVHPARLDQPEGNFVVGAAGRRRARNLEFIVVDQVGLYLHPTLARQTGEDVDPASLARHGQCVVDQLGQSDAYDR